MNNPAQRINQFFSKHGSPVAGMGGFFVRAGAKFGVDPRLIAAIVMKETEGGKTGTGRPGQYNLTGVGGVGNMHSYPNYRASIMDTAKNLGSPRYRGKPLPVQTAMWVAGTPPSASTAPYTRDVRGFMGMLGGSPGGMPPQTGVQPRPPHRPNVSAPPGMGKQPRGFDATYLLQSLGQTTGVPWMLPPPMVSTSSPSTPGMSPSPGGSKAPGRGPGGSVMPLPTKLTTSSEFRVVDAEGAPSRNGTRYHAAKDWFAPGGTRVSSAVTGKVVEANPSRGNSGQVFGGTVKVQMPNGMVIVYRHVAPTVKVGQRVSAGQPVAGVVNWTDGSPHVHIEIWKTLAGGYHFENMIDPVPFFQHAGRGGGGGNPKTGAGAPAGGRQAGFKTMLSTIAQAKAMGLTPKENFALGAVHPGEHVQGSYHNRHFPGNSHVGEGLDVSGTPQQMSAFWHWVQKTYPNVTELFYSPVGFLKNGKPTTLPANLVASHYNHVHVAFGPGHY